MGALEEVTTPGMVDKQFSTTLVLLGKLTFKKHNVLHEDGAVLGWMALRSSVGSVGGAAGTDSVVTMLSVCGHLTTPRDK